MSYIIDNKKKVIIGDVLKLTEKDEKEIAKFQKFGYTFIHEETQVKKVERVNQQYIEEFLADDEKALADFKAEMKKPVLESDGKTQKKTVKGKPRTKGFSAGLVWFAKNYEPKNGTAEDLIKKEGKTDELNRLYATYSKKDVKAKMTLEEYTRYFYWKNVFEKLADKK